VTAPRGRARGFDEVGGLLRAYAHASDVTVSIELPDDHGTLLIAVEAGSALVGLAAPDGI